jgi:hypothetical protein
MSERSGSQARSSAGAYGAGVGAAPIRSIGASTDALFEAADHQHPALHLSECVDVERHGHRALMPGMKMSAKRSATSVALSGPPDLSQRYE